MTKTTVRKTTFLVQVAALLLALVVNTPTWAQIHYRAYDTITHTFETLTVTDYSTLTSSTTTLDNPWYVVSSDQNVYNRINVTGTVNLILCDGVTLTALNGINLPSGATLNIYGQVNGTGTLLVNLETTSYTSAIGGNINESGGNLTIHGGNITAIGGREGAGIGGGSNGNCGSVVIMGGTIHATGGASAAGIGGGFYGSGVGSSVVILGGIVYATGGENAAGIGGGIMSNGLTSVEITGGTVHVQGGSNAQAIGHGYNAYGSGGLSLGNMMVYADSTATNPVAKESRGSTCQSTYAKIVSCTHHYEDGICTWCGNEIPSITYKENGATSGTVPDGSVYLAGETATVLGNTGNLARTGYVFSGWNTVQDGSGTDYAIDSSFSIDSHIILYAKWTPITFSVRFNKNDNEATGSMDDQTFTYDIAQDLTANGFTPSTEGLGFAGWSTSPNGEVDYTDGQNVSNLTFVQDSVINLYAQWGPIVYSISYNMGDGTLTTTHYTYTVNDDTIILDQPTRTGYNFDGWHNNSGLTGDSITAIPSGSTGDIALWAKWSPKDYTISYNLMDGTLATTHPSSYTIESEPVTLINPTREGYVFYGWTGTGLSSITETVTIPTGSTGDREYTAVWALASISLVNDADNSSIITSSNGYLSYGVTLTGRTLYCNGSWNTLCLPFNLTSLTGTPLQNAIVKTLTDATFENHTLTLNFSDTNTIEAGKPYIVKWEVINSQADWEIFTSNVNNYQDKTVRLATDINVTSMVDGTFMGTLDGCGHTITLNLSSGNTEQIALFNTLNNATIKNLKIDGRITYGKHRPAAIASYVSGTTTIQNCWSDVDIVSNYTSSDWVDAGAFIARVNSGATLNMTNCLFTGSITYHANNYEGGSMVGWAQTNATTNLTNCLFAPSALTMSKSDPENKTYIFVSGIQRAHLSGCYYNTVANNTSVMKKEGTHTTTTGSDLQALLGNGWEVSGDSVLPIMQNTLSDIVSPVFANVTIRDTLASINTTYANFTGSYAPTNSGILDIQNPNGDALHATLQLTAPTIPAGYSSFEGWFSNAEKTAAVSTIPFAADGTSSLYAKYTPIEYTIGYDLDGGSVASANPTTYTIEREGITLVNPTKENYAFGGWIGTDLNKATINVTIPSGSTGDREYTATWLPMVKYCAYNNTTHRFDTLNAPAYYPVTSQTTTMGAANTETWYVANENVSIDARIEVLGDVHLILCDGKTLSVATGFHVKQPAAFSVHAQSEGTGVLNATTANIIGTSTNYHRAGIGTNGNNQVAEVCGDITIHGGTVTAIGGRTAAGIGGGHWGTISNITIRGGHVSARGFDCASGIGSGKKDVSSTSDQNTYVGTVVITGGTVICQGHGSQAIGYGYHNVSSNLELGHMKAYSNADATVPVELSQRMSTCRSGYVRLEPCTEHIWVENTCKWCGATHGGVAYNANNATSGTVPVDTTHYISGTTVTVQDSGNLTRTGYTFAGWNTAANSSGDNYEIDSTFTFSSPVTLYAQWTPITYSISYDLADGIVATSNPTTYTVESNSITLLNPTKEGYSFYGWAGTDLADTTPIVTIPTGSYGNRTYAANWKRVLTLYGDADNNATIASTNGETIDSLYLAGHTLYRDGSWNTLCVPFDVANLSGTPLEGATVKTIQSSSYDDGTLTMSYVDATTIEAGKPYIVKWNSDLIIRTQDDWNAFAANVNNGTDSYAGKTVKLAADISVTTMVGTVSGKTQVNAFKGTFDGCGHTLDVNITDRSNQGTAPFRYISDATIKNLKTTGTVTGNLHCSGLVGFSSGTTNTIRNCHVAVNVVCNGGNHSHCGGILGHSVYSATTIIDCLFSGSISGTTTATGIIFGWGGNGTHTIVNCLAAGTYTNCTGIDLLKQYQGTMIATNSYKTQSIGSYGTHTTATGETLRALLGNGWEVKGNSVVPKMRNSVNDIETPVFNEVVISDAAADITTEHIAFFGSNAPLTSGLLDANNPNGDALHAAISINNLTNNGYTFGGWYTNTGLTDTVTSIPFAADGSVILYAKWTPVTYTVHFNKNNDDATGTMPDQAFTFDEAQNLTANGFSPSSQMEFVGWSTEENGSLAYTNGQQVMNLAAKQDTVVNLYAIWTDIYTIDYNLAGGTTATENPTRYNAYSSDITLVNPTREHYDFAGWTGTGLTSATTTVTIPTGSTGGRSYTANWTPINYTITFVNHDNTVLQSSHVGFGETPVYSNATPTMEATPIYTYTFEGWTPNITTVTGDCTYTAWFNQALREYTITYNGVEDATFASSNPTTYNYESATITLVNPTKPGYTFAGWTGSNGDMPQTTVTITAGSIGDRTYTAHFSIDMAVGGGAWQAISSPMHNSGDDETVAGITGLATASYDMFRYNENEGKWENQKAGNGAIGFSTLERGRGYIYRRSGNATLSFIGYPNSGAIGDRSLSFTTATGALKGFHLVGNPYPHTLSSNDLNVTSGSLATGYYTLNPDGTWIAHPSGTIAIGEAFLVQAAAASEITFNDNGNSKHTAQSSQSTTTSPLDEDPTSMIAITVTDSTHVDVAYAIMSHSADASMSLRKIGHLEGNLPTLSIAQDIDRYAIAMMSDETENFNLNFSGVNHDYTIFAEPTVSISYLHLIDRLTGADIDLLREKSYTFKHSNTQTVANRFQVKLTPSDGSTTEHQGYFAHQVGDQIVIDGEGVLQVYDITGRLLFHNILSTHQHINISNFPSTGVYILRLGDQNQKIVITK